MKNLKEEEAGMLVYDGEFKHDEKCGQGTAVFTDECVFKREWENDLFNGEGEMRWGRGDKYKGMFIWSLLVSRWQSI